MKLGRDEAPSPPPPWAVAGEGLLAGILGTAVMTLAQTKVVPKLPIPQGREPRRTPEWPPEREAKHEPTTETAARRLVEGMARHRLAPERKKRAGDLVHFGVGASWGTLLALVRPAPRVRDGLLFGALVWAVNENLVLPLLRLASWPNRYAFGVHAKALLAHLAYGAGTALALRQGTRLASRLG